MLKSIRWTLQLWHAGLLTLVLIGFGAATYFTTSRLHYRQIDADLERSALMLARALWLHPANESARGTNPTRPASTQMDSRRERDGSSRRLVLDLPPGLTQVFGDGQVHELPYFVVWQWNGREVAVSSRPETASQVPDPRADIPTLSRWERGQEPAAPRFRQRGEWREVYVFGPYNIPVLVGKSIHSERLALRHLALTLVLTGGAVLLLGLGGGWVISQRAIRPIREIAATAKQISVSNLSRRINAAETTSELGQLAGVLNDMFARLEEAFQEHIRFTADASHELRTPIAVVHTNVQVSLTRDRTVEEYRKSLETCLRASTRMKDLVDSLLLLAGGDSARLVLDRAPLNLQSVTSECLAMVESLGHERGVSIETDLREAAMVGDESRIAEVITNLLTNAIRYNRSGGQVRVLLTTEGADNILTVTDTGIGISAEHQPHVFKRFYRVDAARSRAAGGSGLGLAICKSIVEAHGGSITLSSVEGEGTTVTVRLPGTNIPARERELSAR